MFIYSSSHSCGIIAFKTSYGHSVHGVPWIFIEFCYVIIYSFKIHVFLCREFRKTRNSFDVLYVCNFLRYRSIWYVYESLLIWRVCVAFGVCVSTCSIWGLRLCGLAVNEPHSCQLCHIACPLWSLQQPFQFPLAPTEQCVVWCSMHDLWGSSKGNNNKDSCPENMVARTTHTQRTLEI